MGFLPTGPYTVTLAILVLVVAGGCFAFGDKPDRRVGLALLVSLFFARLGTAEGAPMINAGGLVLAAYIAFKGKTVACLTITAFYAVRLMITGAPMAGLLTLSMMAELSNFVLILQLVVASGGLFGGHVISPTRHVGMRRSGGVVYLAQVLAKRVAI